MAEDNTGLILFVLFSAICFAIGFGLSWIRARRRIQEKIDNRLRKEIEGRVAEELLKRLASGPLADDIQKAVREAQEAEQGGGASAGSPGADAPSDAGAGAAEPESPSADDKGAGNASGSNGAAGEETNRSKREP